MVEPELMATATVACIPLAGATSAARPAILDVFPLSVGATWIYSVTLDDVVEFHWTGLVTETITAGKTQGAAWIFQSDLQGHPFRSQPMDRLQSYVALDHRVYKVPGDRDPMEFVATEGQSFGVSQILTWPLGVGQKWGPAEFLARDDGRYYIWRVEAKESMLTPNGKFDDCYRLAFDWTDSRQLAWFCPGTGFVRWETHHRGSRHDEVWELNEFHKQGSTSAPVINWQPRIRIADTELVLDLPAGWARQGTDWAWALLDAPGQLVGVNWNEREPGWEPTATLPNHAVMLDARPVQVGWSKAMSYTVQVFDSAAQGGQPIAVETHIIILAEKRAYDIYASARTADGLAALTPILKHMVDSAAAYLPVSMSDWETFVSPKGYSLKYPAVLEPQKRQEGLYVFLQDTQNPQSVVFSIDERGTPTKTRDEIKAGFVHPTVTDFIISGSEGFMIEGTLGPGYGEGLFVRSAYIAVKDYKLVISCSPVPCLTLPFGTIISTLTVQPALSKPATYPRPLRSFEFAKLSDAQNAATFPFLTPTFVPGHLPFYKAWVSDYDDGSQSIRILYTVPSDKLDANQKMVDVQLTKTDASVTLDFVTHQFKVIALDVRDVRVRGQTGYTYWSPAVAAGNSAALMWREGQLNIKVTLLGAWPQPDESNPHRLDDLLLEIAESLRAP